jgi:hypothetical protein
MSTCSYFVALKIREHTYLSFVGRFLSVRFYQIVSNALIQARLDWVTLGEL